MAHGPVTAFGISQGRQGDLRFVVSEGTVRPGPLLQIGNTTSRVDFGCDPGRVVRRLVGPVCSSLGARDRPPGRGLGGCGRAAGHQMVVVAP